MKIEHDYQINQRVKEFRKMRGFNQKYISNKLGIKVSAYSQMEREGRIRCDTLVKIAEILDIDAYFILYGKKHLNTERKEEENYKEVKKQLSRYDFLSNANKKDLMCIKTIYSLRKNQRLAVLATPCKEVFM